MKLEELKDLIDLSKFKNDCVSVAYELLYYFNDGDVVCFKNKGGIFYTLRILNSSEKFTHHAVYVKDLIMYDLLYNISMSIKEYAEKLDILNKPNGIRVDTVISTNYFGITTDKGA